MSRVLSAYLANVELYLCGWIESVILYSGEKVVFRRRVHFSVDLGGEGEWPDGGCLTACIPVP